jgi:hypothetical protein
MNLDEQKKYVINTLSIYRKFLKRETTQTKEMLLIFKDLLHKQLGANKNPTEDEIKEAIKQLKDIGKIAGLIPLVLLPGSILTIPILVKLGKKYNIDILPS